jgi:ABC-type transporter lipoprotein component MlaA
MHSVDCIESNSKSGVKFWGATADSYNNITKTHRHHTAKNLKDHWVAYNKQVFLFNQIYKQESLNRQSGADDDMVLEIVKQ